MTTPAHTTPVGPSVLADKVTELSKQVAELKTQRITYMKAPVTAVDKVASTFSAQVSAQADGATVSVSGIASPAQFLPVVGNTVTVALQGATPIYQPTIISPGAVSPLEVAPNAPAAPTGLTLSASSTITSSGAVQGQITATWTPPTLTAGGTALVGTLTYSVQYRATGTPSWSSQASTTATALLLVASGISYDVQVAAVDQVGNVGAYTATSTIVAGKDTVPPAAPTTPVVGNYLGQLKITWDGALTTGAVPADFAYVEVHVSGTTGFTPSSTTLVSQLSAGGVAYATATYGTTTFAKLIAVDFSGNKSTPSAQASGATSQVVGADILAGAVAAAQLADLSVTTAKMVDGAVINAKIAAGAVATTNLVDTAVTTAKIAAAAVGTSQIADASVITAKIAAGAVATTNLVDASVITAKIAAAAVDGTKIANLAVGTANIADGAIVNAKIGTAAVNTANIASAAITTALIGSAAVGTAQIATAAITSAQIADLTVTSADIANGAIINAKIGTAAVNTANIASAAITTALIGNLQVDTAQIADGAIQTAKIGTAQVGSAQIANLAVATANIANAAVVNAKIGTLAVNDAQIGSLAAGKITAGTMSADVVMGGRFATALTGARTEMNSLGFQKFDSSGNLIVSITGSATLLQGNYKTASTGRRIEINSAGSTGSIDFYSPSGQDSYLTSYTEPNSPFYESIQMSMNVGGHYLWNSVNVDTIPQIAYHSKFHEFGMTTNGSFQIGEYTSSASFVTGLIYRLRIDSTGFSLARPGGVHAIEVLETASSHRISLMPQGPGNGGVDIIDVAGFTTQSARIQAIQPDGGGVMIKTFQSHVEIRDLADSVFDAIWASAFTVNSDADGKTDITNANLDAVPLVKGLQVRSYRRKPGKDKDGNLQPQRPLEIGLVTQEAPPQIVIAGGASDGTSGVDHYQYTTLLAAAMQQIIGRVEALERKGPPA